MKKILLSFSVVAMVCATVAHGQAIHLYAGRGANDVTEGCDAISVKLTGPWGIATDDAGNVYYSEPSTCLVRKIDIHGIITTVAGTGTPGSLGNGGPATNAQLNMPYGIAIDHKGNLYIADTKNGTIRKVNPAGIINTIAYSMYDPFDLAVDSANNLYVSDAGHYTIKKIAPDGAVSVFKDGFSSYLPSGAYGYTGDLWYTSNSRLSGITVDNAGNVYLADYWDNIIRKIKPDGNMNTIAGHAGIGLEDYSGDGGPAIASKLHGPKRITLDNEGNVVFSDLGNYRIRKIDGEGNINTIVGNGGAGYSGDGGLAVNAKLYNPVGLAYDKSGNLYIADNGNNCIRKVTPKGVQVMYLDGAKNMRIVPNPNTGNFTLVGQVGVAVNTAQIAIVDLLGRVVFRSSEFVQNGSINASISLGNNIANGTYLLHLTAGTETSTRQFVIGR